jgi:NTP pyrophosphatase (non-canonical NTP hydrolase)
MARSFEPNLTYLAKGAVATFGHKHQLAVAMEEAGEFIAAASKVTNRGLPVGPDLLTEVADMIIMARQLEIMYAEEMEEWVPKKLDKLKGHINASSNHLS